MILIGMILPTVNIYAEETDKTVTLVVSGEANSKDEAVKQALRSAIEQTFGTFVSANTEVLNDELIKDEIVTVSTGNITGYKEIDTYQTKDGNYFTTLEATVSIGNLTNFVRSKGISAELATGAFAMNMKIRELNKTNEIKVLENMLLTLEKIANEVNLFDYRLQLSEPYINHKSYSFDAKITFIPNKNLLSFCNILYSTLKSLSLSESDIEDYKKANLPFSYFEITDYKSETGLLNAISDYNTHEKNERLMEEKRKINNLRIRGLTEMANELSNYESRKENERRQRLNRGRNRLTLPSQEPEPLLLALRNKNILKRLVSNLSFILEKNQLRASIEDNLGNFLEFKINKGFNLTDEKGKKEYELYKQFNIEYKSLSKTDFHGIYGFCYRWTSLDCNVDINRLNLYSFNKYLDIVIPKDRWQCTTPEINIILTPKEEYFTKISNIYLVFKPITERHNRKIELSL